MSVRPGQNMDSSRPGPPLNTSKQRIARISNQNREVWFDFPARQKTPKAGNRSALRRTRFAATAHSASATPATGRERGQGSGQQKGATT